jgi:hypothetical protein
MSSFFFFVGGGGTKGFFTLRNFVVERIKKKLQNKLKKLTCKEKQAPANIIN